MIYEGVEYRQVHGFADYYVSCSGAVLSIKNGHTRKKKGVVVPSGHVQVKLSRCGKHKTIKIHTLVLCAWKREKRAEEECRHLNGNPADNRIENLTWGTRSENMIDGYRRLGERTPRRGQNVNTCKLTESQVFEIRKKYIPHKRGVYNLAREYGMSKSAIQFIVNGVNWKHLLPPTESDALLLAIDQLPEAEQ